MGKNMLSVAKKVKEIKERPRKVRAVTRKRFIKSEHSHVAKIVLHRLCFSSKLCSRKPNQEKQLHRTGKLVPRSVWTL